MIGRRGEAVAVCRGMPWDFGARPCALRLLDDGGNVTLWAP